MLDHPAAHMDCDAAAGATDATALFLGRAARDGSRPAVGIGVGEPELDYAALAGRVRCLAGAIARRTTQARVLIAVPPGADAYAAMFATGMAGGVYAPINHAAPLAKQRLIAARFDPDIVVTTASAWPHFADVVPHATLLDPATLGPDLSRPEGAPLAEPVPPEARHPLAYVIFTSGSTGNPKGVEILRSSLDLYVGWMGRALDIHPGDRVSQYANIAFDLSVMEIYGALCHGASLHPPLGMGDRLFPASQMRRDRLTHWISVPSVVSLMRQSGDLTEEHAATVRRFVFCGEPLTPGHVHDLLRAAPGAVVQNTYGPTEATVSVTSIVLSGADLPRLTQPSVPLGDAIPGMEIRLVGGPHKDEGELVLLGPQLARGYLEDAQATARAFRTVETEHGPRRGYHTGDWARRIEGELYFQARTDFQIKHNGYRIELGEIQAALAASGVMESVVFVAGGKLVAIVENGAEGAVRPPQLRHALKRLIDAHAVPDVIIAVPLLPRNENDKVDRNAAVAMYAAQTSDGSGKG